MSDADVLERLCQLKLPPVWKMKEMLAEEKARRAKAAEAAQTPPDPSAAGGAASRAAADSPEARSQQR